MRNTRKTALTMANAIYDNTENNLTNAFKAAWAITKQQRVNTSVAGVTFGNRQKALNRLGRYETGSVAVTLEREAGNEYDTNAVRVMVGVRDGAKYHLGYLPKRTAMLIAPLLDKGITVDAGFKSVTGGYEGRETYGALITLEL